MSSIAENIAEIRRRMARAAQAAGRDVSQIQLVGASKMNDAAACRAAIGAPLHFIGHLQRNKVRQVVGKVSLIHSVSSLPLLEEIEKEAGKRGIVQDILLEVNVGNEESKSGFAPSEVFAAAERARELNHVALRGLMTIPPAASAPGENLPYFQEVARLYIDIGEKLYDNKLSYLSMGMSDDFEDAIAAGATLVRVGSAIFGRRNYFV